MGAGSGGDAQYLVASDLLGYSEWWTPRHSKQYRNFRAELDRLQVERESAFKEFAADVDSGAYPEERHVVHAEPGVCESFLSFLDD
jgi:3-methyl-2-oxobutanoate hydroxymethyltransferase